MPTFRLDDERDPCHRRLHLAGRRAGDAAGAEARRSGERPGSLRNPRLHGLPLDGRRQPEAGRDLRREPQPRGRKGELRLPRALGPQPARAVGAVLPVREEGPHRGGLQAAQSAVRLRPRAHQVPERRPRAASPADDSDAEPASHRRGGARHRELPDDAQARPNAQYADASYLDDPSSEEPGPRAGAQLRLRRLP